MMKHLEPLPREAMSPSLQVLLEALDNHYSEAEFADLFLTLYKLLKNNEEDLFRLLVALIERKQVDSFKTIVESSEVTLHTLDMTMTKTFEYSKNSEDEIIIAFPNGCDTLEAISEEETPFRSRRATHAAVSYESGLNLLDLALYEQCDIEFIKFLLREGLRPTQPENLHLQFVNKSLQKAYDTRVKISFDYRDQYQPIIDMYAAIQNTEHALEAQQPYACSEILAVLARYQPLNTIEHRTPSPESVLYEYIAHLIKDMIEHHILPDEHADDATIAKQNERIFQLIQFVESTIEQTEHNHRQHLTTQWHNALYHTPLIGVDIAQFENEQFGQWAQDIKTALQNKRLSRGWQQHLAIQSQSTPGNNGFFASRPPDTQDVQAASLSPTLN